MGSTYVRNDSANNIADGNVISAADLDGEFDKLVTAFTAGTGHTHDGTAGEGGYVTKLLGTAITIGDGTAGTDIAVTFDGETNDGTLTWMEDEDYFTFSDDILMATTEKIQFLDAAIYIHSPSDGQLDAVADSVIQVTAPTVNIEASTAITLESDAITLGENGDTDIVLTFNANSADGVITWMEDEDYFKFSDDIMIVDNEQLIFGSDSDIAISYDEATTDSLKIAATEGAGLAITLMADEGDDAGDEWKLNVADGGIITLGNDIASAGSYVTHLTLTPHATVASSTMAAAGSVTVGDNLSLVSDSAVLGFGADTDTTLTHTDGTGLTLNSTNKLTFGDVATFIHQSTDGQLDVDADTELELTAPTVDIAASTAVTIATPSLIISDNTTDEPIVQIKNTHNGTTAGELRFVMDKGSAGADGDDLGTISFYGDDSGQAQTAFASIVGEVSESANTDEAGKLSLFVAESDGTTTALAAGLVLEGEHATNGEVDVTIAAGTASTTTVAGSLVVTTDLDVDGTANLDIVDIDGAVDMATTLTVGTDLTITNGDIVFGTSGNGINLGVTSNTDANTLDDYEEGTYTVALTCGTSGSVALKSTNNTGRYTKIGRICHVNCDARIDSVSSPSGSMIFSLPFASANPASDEHATLGTMITHGTTKQSGQVGNFFPIVNINAASFTLAYENASTRLAVTHDNVGIGANDEFVFTLTYTTA